MISKVPVSLGTRSYDILIGDHLAGALASVMQPFARRDRWIVVTDAHVAEHWLPSFSSSLKASVEPIILPAGEGTKSWDHLASLCDQLLALGVERDDHVIALGGGVIGDLVGFATSIIKRGCGFIQVPTTLLAQVDSSVGGKTAINTASGKNLVGAFHQPSLVIIDPAMLDTLPQRELRAGYAEVVKYGLINDFAFFEWCEANGKKILSGDRDAQTYAIETSVRAKAAIVAADERETQDVRALLNLGHTFGHSLEAETGFSSALIHGEAVAAGMAMAHRFSAAQALCSGQDASRVTTHLSSMGLPTTLKDCGITAASKLLVGHMMHDKKMTGGILPFILTRGIGQAYVDKSIAMKEVTAFLDSELR